jgi:F1F0 ATPase subunit 2
MMTDILLSGLAGLLLGAFFFGGLWLTVQKLATSKRPALWVIGSFLLRMSVTMTGFYVVANDGDWQRLLGCLLGFIMARLLVIKLTPVNTEDAPCT